MSGSLEVHGVIENWPSIKSYLFDDSASSEDNEDNDWGNDWEWRDNNTPTEKATASVTSPQDKRHEENWPQNCVIANSPMCDMFVVAKGQKAVFLTSEWDAQSNTKYAKSFEGKLSQDGELITSALCVPLISKKKSSPGTPDWTCVVVGFSDGYVRMYTETGSMLISQMFHDQPVGCIKCNSYQPAAIAMEHDQLEEIFILYKTCVVTMDGFGLFQTLRACRNHLARLQANAAESMIDPPPLSYKKWEYESKGVSDCGSVGVQTPSTFEHLLNASIIGGVYAKPKKIPYTSNVFVTAGDSPYLSFHYAQEGQSIPMIGEIAYAMASKFKSSLISAATGWLGFGGGAAIKSPLANAKPEPPKIEPATPMSARFGLPDKQRKGKTVITSPCRRLLAVTDTLGRVILIDNDRGIAVRVWKGYRDAQCAWLQVDNDMNSKTRASGKKALFLVIYAPRRGQLEVFAMQQGPKVASFAVSKTGRLLVTSYGMMGLNNIPTKGGNKPVIQCLFLDQDAKLYAVNIPFHLALCDNNNSKLKDMHLLKSLQRLLRESQYSEENVTEILHDIKTQAMINQAFKILTQNCKKVDVLAAVVEGYMEKFCEDESRDLSVIFRIQSLLQLYSYLLKSSQMPPPYSESTGGAGSSTNENTILLCFHTTEKEIKLIKDIANKELFNKSPTKTVSFQDDTQFMSVNEFFNSFELEFDPVKMKSSSSATESKLKLNAKSDNLEKLGKLLLCGCLNNNADLKEWKSNIKNSDLIPIELLQETLNMWSRHALMSSSFVVLMERLYNVVKALCELEGSDTVVNRLNESSWWWDNIRKVIACNSKIFYIYTFSIVCRAVSIDLQQQLELEDRKCEEKKLRPEASGSEQERRDEKMELDKIEDDDEEGWENVSVDLIKWNILLKQIEDISFLSTILAQHPPLENPTLPVLPSAMEELSVISLQEKGKGCIAELVGRWLTTIGIDPVKLVSASELEERETTPRPELTDKELKQKLKASLQSEADVSKDDDKMDVDPDQKALEASLNMDSEINYILELISCLKDNFPVSLNSSIILSNYCWEYCLEWNKDVEAVEYLDAAISCVCVVPSNYIRQGLMSMMWSTFITKQFSNIVTKGKIGREKLMEKVSGISSQENKERLLRACVKFLDDFMETNVHCAGSQAPRDASSKKKKNHWASDTSNASLTDLAVLQPHANYEMILLHYQLSLAALFSHAFNIKKASMKPMNLFDTKARMMLTYGMSSLAPYSNVEVDLALRVLREEFLCLVVTNAIYAIPEELDSTMEDENPESDETRSIIPSHEGVVECEYWINKCFELGRIWGIDLDGLRINQVCEYYSSGFDQLGRDAIGCVNTREILGSKLLIVAGMRLHYIIETNRKDSMEIVSALSTNLSNWLNKLNYSRLRCLRFPKTSITELAQQLVQLIPESSYDYNLADELLLCSTYLT